MIIKNVINASNSFSTNDSYFDNQGHQHACLNRRDIYNIPMQFLKKALMTEKNDQKRR
ncbi:MAG: hypothetical protein M3Q77_09635 [Thermoproteota archaeon]|nr:hypothetical protein [Thermoproteota archaeon]